VKYTEQLIENIVNGKAADAASQVQKALNSKLARAIKEEKSAVASDVYGGPDEVSTDESFNGTMPTYASLMKAQADKNAHQKANAAVNNWGAHAKVHPTFSALQKKAHVKEAESSDGPNVHDGKPIFNYKTHNPGHPFHGSVRPIYKDVADKSNAHSKANNLPDRLIKQKGPVDKSDGYVQMPTKKPRKGSGGKGDR